ncbi:hypothetical protein ACFO9E_34940 [Streptomyces maoxianensis]|uniref:DNA-binding protein n=1 Tax=Streptomyces maoxianensis TaxID=1459942 RepID=A0ABV9GI86_9ACTN
MPQAARLVDTAQIVEEFDTSRPRISVWSNNADSGFPSVARTTGRKRFWRHDQVAAFFAERATRQRKLSAAVLESDQDELLGKAEVAKLLGYTRVATIDAYRRDRPGYFPKPDQQDTDGQQWRRGTIVAWATSRPGKGRRRSAPASLPQTSAHGNPDELLGISEAATLLGYSSVASFLSALSQGNIPELPQPEALKKEGRARPRKKWRRATLVAAARQRGTLPPPYQEDDDMVGASEAAQILGYANTSSFLSALGHGTLPELDEPDGFKYRRGSAGPPRQQRWKRLRLEALAERRASP